MSPVLSERLHSLVQGVRWGPREESGDPQEAGSIPNVGTAFFARGFMESKSHAATLSPFHPGRIVAGSGGPQE